MELPDPAMDAVYFMDLSNNCAHRAARRSPTGALESEPRVFIKILSHFTLFFSAKLLASQLFAWEKLLTVIRAKRGDKMQASIRSSTLMSSSTSTWAALTHIMRPYSKAMIISAYTVHLLESNGSSGLLLALSTVWLSKANFHHLLIASIIGRTDSTLTLTPASTSEPSNVLLAYDFNSFTLSDISNSGPPLLRKLIFDSRSKS